LWWDTNLLATFSVTPTSPLSGSEEGETTDRFSFRKVGDILQVISANSKTVSVKKSYADTTRTLGGDIHGINVSGPNITDEIWCLFFHIGSDFAIPGSVDLEPYYNEPPFDTNGLLPDEAETSYGWGSAQHFSWKDRYADLDDLYLYAMPNKIIKYEEGSGDAILLSLPSTPVNFFGSLCVTNSRVAVSYDIGDGRVGQFGRYVCYILNLTGTIINTLGIYSRPDNNTSYALGDPDAPLNYVGVIGYGVWMLRINPDDDNLIDILQPEDPKVSGLNTDLYIGVETHAKGAHTWNEYSQYNTVDDSYNASLIRDSRLALFRAIKRDVRHSLRQQLVPSSGDPGVGDDVNIDQKISFPDRHQWGHSLFLYKTSFVSMIESPDRDKVLAGWGESFGGKKNYQDFLLQKSFGGEMEAGRHGSVVLGINDNLSTGKIHRLTEYTPQYPDDVILYEHIFVNDLAIGDIFTVDFLTELENVPNIDEYGILQIRFRLNGDVDGLFGVYLNGDNINSNYINRNYASFGVVLSSTETVATPVGWNFPLTSFVSRGQCVLNFIDWRNTTKKLAYFGMYPRKAGASTISQELIAGVYDNPGPITSVSLSADEIIEGGSQILITAKKTKARINHGDDNGYMV
jgi:hypothetical protein